MGKTINLSYNYGDDGGGGGGNVSDRKIFLLL